MYPRMSKGFRGPHFETENSLVGSMLASKSVGKLYMASKYFLVFPPYIFLRSDVDILSATISSILGQEDGPFAFLVVTMCQAC